MLRGGLAARPSGRFLADEWAWWCAALLVLLFVPLHSLLEWPGLDWPLFALNTATADAAMAWLATAGVPLVREGTLVLQASVTLSGAD